MTLSDWRERTWGSRRWHRQRMWWRRRQSRSCESVTLKVTKTLKATTTSRDTTWRTEWRKERQFRVSFFCFFVQIRRQEKTRLKKIQILTLRFRRDKENFCLWTIFAFLPNHRQCLLYFFLFWWGLFIGLILTRFCSTNVTFHLRDIWVIQIFRMLIRHLKSIKRCKSSYNVHVGVY